MLNLVNYVHSGDDLSEDTISGAGRCAVKMGIVYNIYIKLRCCGIGVIGSCHRDGSPIVFEAVVAFVDYRRAKTFRL